MRAQRRRRRETRNGEMKKKNFIHRFQFSKSLTHCKLLLSFTFKTAPSSTNVTNITRMQFDPLTFLMTVNVLSRSIVYISSSSRKARVSPRSSSSSSESLILSSSFLHPPPSHSSSRRRHPPNLLSLCASLPLLHDIRFCFSHTMRPSLSRGRCFAKKTRHAAHEIAPSVNGECETLREGERRIINYDISCCFDTVTYLLIDCNMQ